MTNEIQEDNEIKFFSFKCLFGHKYELLFAQNVDPDNYQHKSNKSKLIYECRNCGSLLCKLFNVTLNSTSFAQLVKLPVESVVKSNHIEEQIVHDSAVSHIL